MKDRLLIGAVRRRLSGPAGARPPPGARPVHRPSGRRGRRQRPPGQDRGPLPRSRRHPRPDRRRPQARARRGRPPLARSARARRRWAIGRASRRAAPSFPAAQRRARRPSGTGTRAMRRRRPAPRPAVETVPQAQSFPLGVARGQVAATYIVAEAEDGLVLVDQHAAHERLVLERMRRAMANGGVARQALLLPEVVELDEPACDRIEARLDELAGNGPRAGAVRPARDPGPRHPGHARRRRRQGPGHRPRRRARRLRFRALASRRSSTSSPRPWPATARSAPAASSRSPR